MSNSNRVAVYFAEESTYGTAPGSGWFTMPLTGESMGSDLSYATSDTIVSTGAVTDVINTATAGSGNINAELSYELAYFTLYRALVRSSAFTSGEAIVSGIDMAFNGTSKTITASTGTPFTNFDDGDVICIQGAADAGNNGLFRVATATSSTVLTLEDPHSRMVTASAASGVTVEQGSYVTNGTTTKSHYIERHFVDISKYSNHPGSVLNSWTLNQPLDGPITQSFGWQTNLEVPASSLTASSPTAPSLGPIMTGANSLSLFSLDQSSAAVGFEITEANLSITTNARQQRVAGNRAAIGYGVGKIEIRGGFTVYNDGASATETLYAAALSNTAQTDMVLGYIDSAGKGFAWELPNVRITAARRNAERGDDDVLIPFEFQAFQATGASFYTRIWAFDAA